MTQRTVAGLLAVPLLLALWAVAILDPMPYVTYKPGVTVDVLGESDGEPIVQVAGAESYPDDEGQLRMTTVYVSRPQANLNVFDVLSAWMDRSDAVYPKAAVYAPDETDEQKDSEGAVQMVTSQDSAVAAALREMDIAVEDNVEVLGVTPDLPADGRLQVRDVLLRIGDTRIRSAQDVVEAVDAAPVDKPLAFVVRRDGEERTVEVTPREVDGDKRVGITPGPGYTFPFQVDVSIGDDIGGPSAGLIFSLAIYDTLTPGSLVGDSVVAGTGTVDARGRVGPIGGIQQKIAAAHDDGAGLFLVPPDNCAEALGANNGDTRLVRADTVHDAIEAVEAWRDDHDADLPTCEGAA